MKRIFNPFSWLLVFTTLLMTIAQAAGPDEQYVQIYSLIQDADRLSLNGQSDAARAKYLEAQTALKKLQSAYPNWNEKVVKFRVRYLDEKVGPIQPSPAAPVPSVGQKTEERPAAQPVPVLRDERDEQIRSLQEAVARLQAEKAVLETKLREALTAQPAAVDPRELARAEQKLREVEKEKEVLRVSLEQEQAQRARWLDPSAVENLKGALAEANRMLAEQKEKAAALAREREILEKQLYETRRDESGHILRAENESLKKQLAAKSPKTETSERTERLEKELAQAKADLGSTQKKLGMLQQERVDLEKRRKEFEKRLMAATSSASEQEK